MSKNARRKQQAKRSHRDQWSAAPSGTPLAFFVTRIVPASTPLMDMLRRG